MTTFPVIVAAVAAVAAYVHVAYLAWWLHRRNVMLEEAIAIHWQLRHGKSRNREDYNLWRHAQLPIHCLHCGALNADFLECDRCGAVQPFDDSRP